MKHKILIKGPFLSMSGYGEQARFIMRALRNFDDVDLYLENTTWGNTSWLIDDTEERKWIDKNLLKSVGYAQNGGQFDCFIRVSIPNEMEKKAPVNILYTAGIETNKVAPEWLQVINQIDKTIVVSNHAKQIFESTEYDMANKNNIVVGQLSAATPIEAVNYAFNQDDIKRDEDFELELDYDFNFLSVCQWSPRKNVGNMIKWFLEEFYDQEVGLVLKMNTVNNCLKDREVTANKVTNLIESVRMSDEEMKCKVYLLHGNMTAEEMKALYRHPKIKAYTGIPHGEGFGLPFFEAAQNCLPVVTCGWSGPCDFLYKDGKPLYKEVDYNVQHIQPEAVWDKVLIKDSMWAFAKAASFKMSLRKVRKDYKKYKEMAKELQDYLREEFSKEKQYKKMHDAVIELLEISDDEVEEWLDSIEVIE